MQGYVRKLFQEKGFAFIEGSDQRDYFLHWSKVSRNSIPFRNMVENDKVTFDVEEGNQGPKALNLIVRRAQVTDEKENVHAAQPDHN
jgi:cold shock protein